MMNKIIGFIKNHLLIIIIILTIIILVLTTISLKNINKKQPEQPSLAPAPQWQNITPGQTSKTEVKEKLGTPEKDITKENSEVLYYPSDYKYADNQVYIKDRQVSLIKEKIPYQQNLELSTLIDNYGPADLILYSDDLGNAWPIYVYAGQGLAAAAHVKDNIVLEKWYFPPMTPDQFLKTIGSNLSQTPVKIF
jgi:outer membrane protein assembly factor BamE (lipoprotein component of BamABCDE complex)